MKNVSVSIIIPVFNVDNYLRACLNSVINQTFIDYELIIVNDGSSDNSLSIIREYTATNDNIVLIKNQKNQGQSVARNQALDVARGEYVYFLDSDDYIELNALETLYAESKRYNLDVLLFDGKSFYDTDYNVKIQSLENNYSKKRAYAGIVDGKIMFTNLIMNNDYSCSPCLLFIKRERLESEGLRFYDGIIHEDELFTSKLLLLSKRVKQIDKVLFHRRIRPNSTMTEGNYLKRFVGYSVVMKEMIHFTTTTNSINEHGNVRNAINIQIGNMYVNALDMFYHLSSKNKKELQQTVNQLKITAKTNNYFDRNKCRLITHSPKSYYFLRKMYKLFRKY